MSYTLPNTVSNGDRRDIEPIMQNFTSIGAALSSATDNISALQAGALAVDGSKLVTKSVPTAALADDSVTTDKILEKNVVNGSLADNIFGIVKADAQTVSYTGSSFKNKTAKRLGSTMATVTPTRNVYAMVIAQLDINVTPTSSGAISDGFTGSVNVVSSETAVGTAIATVNDGWDLGDNRARYVRQTITGVYPIAKDATVNFGLVGSWQSGTHDAGDWNADASVLSSSYISVILLPR